MLRQKLPKHDGSLKQLFTILASPTALSTSSFVSSLGCHLWPGQCNVSAAPKAVCHTRAFSASLSIVLPSPTQQYLASSCPFRPRMTAICVITPPAFAQIHVDDFNPEA